MIGQMEMFVTLLHYYDLQSCAIMEVHCDIGSALPDSTVWLTKAQAWL